MTLRIAHLLLLMMLLTQTAVAQEWPPSDEVSETTDGFRQTALEEFQWRDDAWEAARRQFMHYDEAGRLLEIDYQSWFNDEWRTSRKETFTYEDSLLTEKLTLERVANRLEQRGREVYAYDTEGRLQSNTLLGWSYEQKWTPIFKYSYAYDEAGRKMQDSKEILNQDLARGAYTIRYEYEDNGKLDAALHMRDQGGTPVLEQRLDYRYDADGRQVERAYQATRTNGESWTDMIKIRYDYGADGRRTTATTQGRGRTDGFEDTSRRLYKYDAHGNLTAKVIQFFREGSWQHGLKEAYTYERIPGE